MRFTKYFLFLLLISASGAHAEKNGPTRGGGGDPIALEFQRCALQAIAEVSADIDQDKNVRAYDFKSVLKDTSIMVVDTPLYSEENGVQQPSTTINLKNPNRIRINRARWIRIKDPVICQALALHEYLSLAGFESTGHYAISHNYLRVRGRAPNDIREYRELPELYRTAIQEQMAQFVPELANSFTAITQEVVRRSSGKLEASTMLSDIFSKDEKKAIFSKYTPVSAPQLFADRFGITYGELLGIAGTATTLATVIKEKQFQNLNDEIKLQDYDSETQVASVMLKDLTWPYCFIQMTVHPDKLIDLELVCD